MDSRSEIEDRLTPTLRRDLQRQFPVRYERARRNLLGKLAAHGETDVPMLPEARPFTLGQVLGDWWSEDR